jgi:hypothetical protein
MDLITFYLLRAFRQEGCSLCRLKLCSESRYIQSFLWEFVNDGDVRVRLRRSLGYCHVHAWQLQETEQNMFGGGLGTGIVYEDLTRRALDGLRALSRDGNAFILHRWCERVRTYLDRWFKPFLFRKRPIQFPPGLVSQAECPVCKTGRESEGWHVQSLAKHCDENEFRESFRASDGLCLPHFRAALEIADTNERRKFLIATAQEKTETLANQLSEFIHKSDWNYRDEPKLPEEQSSRIRAVEFFVGKKSGETQ